MKIGIATLSYWLIKARKSTF